MEAPIRILHLDDNPSDARLVALTLETEQEQLPSTIRFVQTKEEYLSALNRKDFDIILSDYRMPGFDGEEALRAAREICPEIPFIMVTGELGEELVIETLKRGATDYVLKDRIFRLIPAIKRALAEAANERKRREAEQALRESEERFHTMADHIPQLAWMADTRGWIFWYNQRWYDYTGTTLEEMKGWGWQKLVPPESVERVVKKITKCFETGKVWEDTFQLRNRAGEYRWFLSRAHPIRDGQGKVDRWFGTSTDITVQREAEKNRDLTRRAIQAVLHSIEDPLYSLDSQWRFSYVNHKAERYLGKTSAKLHGKIIWEIFPQLQGTELGQKLIVVAGSRLAQHYEGPSPFDNLWHDFHIFPREGSGVSVLFRDITEKRTQQEDLRQREERFASTFMANPYPLVLSRASDGIFIEVNDAFLEFYGTTREEVIGKTSSELGLWPEAKEQIWHEQKLHRDGRAHTHETVLKTQANGGRQVLLSTVLLSSGEEPLTLTIVHDITEPRRVEGEIFDTLAQELKALTRQAIASADHLERDGAVSLDGSPRDYLFSIQKQAKRMEDLVGALLELSRLHQKPLGLVVVDTQRMIEEVVAEQRQFAGEAGRAVSVVIGDVPPVEADPLLLRIVFSHLLSNAFKFTRTVPEPKITIDAERRNGYHSFRVADNGVGFPKGQTERLFKVFQRLHRATEFDGAGIGLAKVRRIVEKHGGQVCGDGEEGKGAVFYFTLPAKASLPKGTQNSIPVVEG